MEQLLSEQWSIKRSQAGAARGVRFGKSAARDFLPLGPAPPSFLREQRWNFYSSVESINSFLSSNVVR